MVSQFKRGEILCAFRLFALHAEPYTINSELLDLIFEKRNLTEIVVSALSGETGNVHMRGNSAFSLPNTSGQRNDITDGVAVALETYRKKIKT